MDEFTRFENRSYALSTHCDEQSKFFSCAIEMRIEHASHTLIFEMLETVLDRIPFVMKMLQNAHSHITTMEHNQKMRMRELLSVAVFNIENCLWRISAVVNIEDREVYIGITDCGEHLRREWNKINYIPNAMTMLQDTIDEASYVIVNRDNRTLSAKS